MRFHSDDLTPAGPTGMALPLDEAERILDRLLGSSIHRREVLDLGARLGLPADGSRVSGVEFEMKLMNALRHGQIELVKRVSGGGGGGGSGEGGSGHGTSWDAVASTGGSGGGGGSSKETDRTTWIEFQLVGEDGQPISGVKYRATMPNGSVREGVTRSSGLVRFDGIPEGTWEFTFPELDQDAWEKA